MKFLKATVGGIVALSLVACGGGDNLPTKVKFTSLVSFGDSLSDVGSYKTSGIASVGGGKYTVNSTTAQIWIERIAGQLAVPAVCPAQTGLNASGALNAFAGPVNDYDKCTGYAQGGSRVTNPIGPWNAALRTSSDPTTAFQGLLGQLTVPVVTQISNHLAKTGGGFSGKELVLVLAGANDVFMNLATVGTSTTPAQAIAATVAAAAELSNLVKTQIVGKGAKYVVVVNLPNISLTPSARASEVIKPGSQALTDVVTQAFNTQLTSNLKNVSGVLLVDAYAQSTDQAKNPTAYNLTNITTPVCSSTSTANPLFGYSLTCSASSTISGDVTHYQYADTVHPTPYAHELLARQVSLGMSRLGWL